MICPGCEGKGWVVVRVQRLVGGHRICHDEEMLCPVCDGWKEATQADLDAFLNTCLPSSEEEQR